MDELRLLLLSLGGVFVVGLAAWEFRRSRVRRGGGTADDAAAAAGRRGSRQEPSFDAGGGVAQDPRDPFDLPDIRTGDVSRDPPLVVLGDGRDSNGGVAIGISDEVAVDRPGTMAARDDAADDTDFDDGVLGPARVVAGPADDTPGDALDDLHHADDAPGASPDTARTAAAHPVAPTDVAGEPAPIQWPPERQDRILALRVVPPSGDRFGGRSLRLAMTSNGLVHGPQDIFHWATDEGRVILSAAGLTRPGTFDLTLMDGQFFLGLQLFSVLPGPLPPQRMLEELVAVGRDIASRLGGSVLDELGRPLDAARIDALQRSLSAPPPEARG
jgi:hypothetical protein